MNNDVLKKLAVSAGCTIDKMGYGEGDIESLAKLIIKECLDTITTGYPVDDKLSDAPYYINLGRHQAANEIKKHFGVNQ